MVSGKVELQLRKSPRASGRLADQLVRDVDPTPRFSGSHASSFHFKVSVSAPILRSLMHHVQLRVACRNAVVQALANLKQR